jgi:hypothetical protein
VDDTGRDVVQFIGTGFKLWISHLNHNNYILCKSKILPYTKLIF